MEIILSRSEIDKAITDFVLKKISGLAVNTIDFDSDRMDALDVKSVTITLKEPEKSTGPTPRSSGMGMTNASQY